MSSGRNTGELPPPRAVYAAPAAPNTDALLRQLAVAEPIDVVDEMEKYALLPTHMTEFGDVRTRLQLEMPSMECPGADLVLAHWNLLADGLSGSTPLPSAEQKAAAKALAAYADDPKIKKALDAYNAQFKKPNGGFAGNLAWNRHNFTTAVKGRVQLMDRTAEENPHAPSIGPRAFAVGHLASSLLTLCGDAPTVLSLVENDRPQDLLAMLQTDNPDLCMIWAPKGKAPTRAASRFRANAAPDGVSLVYDARVLAVERAAVVLLHKEVGVPSVLVPLGELPYGQSLVCAMPEWAVTLPAEMNVAIPRLDGRWSPGLADALAAGLYKQVALYVCFRHASGRRFVVASTHLESDKNSKGERVRQWQMIEIKRTLAAFADDVDHRFVMMDANAAPQHTESEAKDEAGVLYPPLFYTEVFGSPELVSAADRAVGARGPKVDGVYADLLPDELYTTAKSGRQEKGATAIARVHTIDYIASALPVTTVGRLEWNTPGHREWRDGAPRELCLRSVEPLDNLPNPFMPSDHLPVAVAVKFE